MTATDLFEDNRKPSKGIFDNMTEIERCYKLLLIHNTKVQKLLERSKQGYEDRQNGTSRPQTPAATKPKAKTKKVKKKAAPVDITIKFKADDGHVEEIVVKNKVKKKGKPKKKTK